MAAQILQFSNYAKQSQLLERQRLRERNRDPQTVDELFQRQRQSCTPEKVRVEVSKILKILNKGYYAKRLEK